MSKITAVESKIIDFEQKINNIIALKEELAELNCEGFEDEARELDKLLSSPENFEKAEQMFKEFKVKLSPKTEKNDEINPENPEKKQQDKGDEEKDKKVSTSKKEDFKGGSKKIILTTKQAREYSEILKKTVDEIKKVVLGQDIEIERIILCLMCDAHALLEGVPGLAKSLLVEVLAHVIGDTSFNRIQFLPDLLPSDIIGGQIYNPKIGGFKTFKGPIFANFVLADEINRAPPKTHAALMECMQEKKVNIDKDEFILDRPFLVLATMNPLENKGTYTLPEAVLDRFMFKIILDYPNRKSEIKIISNNATTLGSSIKKRAKIVMNKKEFLEMQRHVKNVFISDRIKEYILNIIEATRGLNKNIEGFKFVKYGGGPRASIYLGIAAKAKALFEGRNYVLPDDVTFVAPDILRHRVCLNYKGKAHNISSDKVVEEILLHVNAV